MPARTPAAAPPKSIDAQAASMRRWLYVGMGIFSVLFGVELVTTLGTPAPRREWSDVTLPASLVVMYASAFVKHHTGLYRLLLTASAALLIATFWLFVVEGRRGGSGTTDRRAPSQARTAAPAPTR